MSELDLQEAFRQLALDLDAVRDDDPDLREFELERAGKEVHVEFRAYKAHLEIRVSDPGRKKRPMATLHRANALDRLGRSMGIDEKPDTGDEKFLERFDLQTEAPKEAIAAMLGSRAAREASFELETAGALPVWINGESVGLSAGAGVGDLAHERIAKIIEALCKFEDALGTWDETADRSPIRERGRRVIRKTPRTSASWFAPALDWSPAVAIPVTILSAIPYSALDGWLLDSKISVLVAIAGAIALVTCLLSIRALKGTRSAFLRTIGRTIGVSAIVSQIVFFVLHVHNRSTSPSHVESVVVLATTPAKGRSSGSTDFRVAGDPKIHSIPTYSRSSTRGKSFRLVVHDGRLGWRWVEYAD